MAFGHERNDRGAERTAPAHRFVYDGPVSRGRVERLERHAARLRRDAGDLDFLSPIDARSNALPRAAARVVRRSATASFASNGRTARRSPELIASPRATPLRQTALARRHIKVVHPGREFRANTKYVDVDAYDSRREDVANSDFDEVLLFDAGGNLVEGSQSNCLAVLADGRLITPTLEAGGVEGIGLAIVRDDYPELYETWISGESLDDAHELMSVNTVRGVVPIVELDGKAIGAGVAGPWAIRLAAIFARH